MHIRITCLLREVLNPYNRLNYFLFILIKPFALKNSRNSLWFQRFKHLKLNKQQKFKTNASHAVYTSTY